jgi:hypothetical protein
VDYDIKDDSRRKAVAVIERSGRQMLWKASYRISRARIAWTNFIRKFWYVYYGGAGEPYRTLTPEQLQYYFLTVYDRSLQDLPIPVHRRTGSFIRDSLVYRYMAATVRIVIALVLRR